MTSRKKLTLTITAVLKQWRLSQRVASGIVSESTDKDIPDGMFYLVDVENVFAYDTNDFPKMDDDSHCIIRSATGKYFKIYTKDKNDG